jgi:undecaprenyl diphosphate synthase
VDNVAPIARATRDLGIRHMVVYAFSTENWGRSKREISYLMKIFESMAEEDLAKLSEEEVAVRFIGQKKRFPKSLQSAMRRAEEKNPTAPKLTLWICISYGGRAEIIHAVRTATERNEAITEKTFANHLWTAGMPDPDLIIRTGGAERLSNFLLWQSAYSELFFLKTYWPAFTKAHLEMVLKEYAARERRMGK